MTKIAVVIGSTGGIGAAVCQGLKEHYIVVHVDRTTIDFNKSDCYELLNSLLVSQNPDLIVNCSGHYTDNSEKHYDTMNVNLGSNWSIIKHYIENKPAKKIRLIMIGSSAYREGRKMYMMYAASKAALYNLWLSACEYFDNSNLSIVLINPVKTKTKMMNPTATRYIMPEDVASSVLEHSFGNDNKCIDMSYYKELRND
jgi:NAD(P)-dependent dehydrogenase (short-subunit alcohol dehydrogenase family)